MNAACWALFAGSLALVLGCDAERILATARATGNPTDSGVNPADGNGSSPDSGLDAPDGNGGPIDSGGTPSDAGQPWPPFGTPQPVPGLRGDNDEVQDPSMTFEEVEIYFTSPTGGQNDIWSARRIVPTDPWGPSAMVAELSSPQNDEDPEVSADGLIMYFASDRGGDGMRLYASRRRTRDTPWETPQRVDGLGAAVLDEAPALDRGQLYLVFASRRGTSPTPHLFAAMRPDASALWQNVTEIAGLSSGWEDTDPAVFADGRALMFASRRATQGGTADLFQAVRAGVSSPFTSGPQPITELNTTSSEGDPWVSQDGRHILFVSDRSGRRRIYEAWR